MAVINRRSSIPNRFSIGSLDVPLSVREVQLGNYVNPAFVGIALVIFGVGFVAIQMAEALWIIFTIFLVWRAKGDVLLPLLIMFIVPSDFVRASNGDSIARDVLSGTGINVLGFPLSARLSLVFLVPLRVFCGLITNERKYNSRVKWLMWLWLVAFVPIFIGTIEGWKAGYENWTRPARFLGLTASFFYGILLTKRSTISAKGLLDFVFIPFVSVMLLFVSIGMVHQHFRYFLSGMGASIAWYSVVRGGICRWVYAPCILAGVFVSALHGAFTDILLAIVGVGMGVLTYGNLRAKAFNLGSFLSSLATIIIFVFGTVFYCQARGVVDVSQDLSDSVTDRIVAKIAGDRAGLWVPAFQQIIGGPYLIVPAGRPVQIRTDTLIVDWSVGVHNALLESIRVAGVLGGGIILFIAWSAIYCCFKAVRMASSLETRTIAGGIITIGLVGFAVEDFVLDQNVAFWGWSVAGIAYAMALRQNPEVLVPRRMREYGNPTRPTVRFRR